MSLEGKVALVTGGGTGIGRGVARCLLAAGAVVVVAGRSESSLNEAVEELLPIGSISSHVCDVTDHAQVHALIDDIVAEHRLIDVLVCSHGVLNAGYSLIDYPLDLWEQTIATNLTGTFLCAQGAARVMVKERVAGRIINISSIVAVASAPLEVAYDASKGGVESLTRAMCLDLAPHGITVNSVSPGWIRTAMVADLMQDGVQKVSNPLRRYGEPEHVGDAVVWLADPSSSHITGATIFIDGGQRAALAGNPLNM